MKIFHFILIIFLTGPASYQIKAQADDKVLAKIGNISISEKEFRLRYELSPHLGLHQRNMQEALKEGFLYTLIAEKLLALDALESRLDTNEIVSYTLKEFEKMFVRDALYKTEIRDKAASQAYSLMTSYISEASEFRAIYIYETDAAAINRIFNLLEEGVAFDTLYSELSSGKGDTLKFRIGDLEEDNESEILKTREGSYTRPVFLNNNYANNQGWYILKIIKRNSPVLAKLKGWETEFKRLEKIAGERAEAELYNKFFTSFFGGKQFNANVNLMKSASEKISAILSSKQAGTEKKFLDAADLFRIENLFGEDSLNLPYIRFENSSVSLRNFLRYFRIENFYTEDPSSDNVLRLLNGKTQKFIREEMLAEEGYRRGLQHSDEVKESYSMWRDNYLAELAGTDLRYPDVTESELLEEYENFTKGKDIKVNIVEVLTDSLEIVEQILNRINRGEDMHTLAKEYSKRELTKKTAGEFGYFSTAMHGEIGRIAGTMEKGEIYGPLKVPEGYSVFQLIDKQEEERDSILPFELVKNELLDQLSVKNSRHNLEEYTAELAMKHRVEIDYNLLRSIRLTSISMVGFRYLGFGSRITAVPLLPPNEEWVKSWLEQKKIAP